MLPRVIADRRESHLVVQALRKLKAEVIEKSIGPGDYVVGENYAIERKIFRDFIQSIYKKQLFEQLERLHSAYRDCYLIVEGDIDYGLAKIITEWNIPIIFTMNQEQTAQFIFSLAKKLQEERKERVEAIYKPKLYSLAEKRRFAVQELPTVWPKSADLLLWRFCSVRRVFPATEGELMTAEGFGEKRAREISEFLDKRYLTGTL